MRSVSFPSRSGSRWRSSTAPTGGARSQSRFTSAAAGSDAGTDEGGGLAVWCLRYLVEPGTQGSRLRECWYESAVDAFEAYAEAEAAVRLGDRPWAQLWSPRGNCEA